jgi:hypothetical protein
MKYCASFLVALCVLAAAGYAARAGCSCTCKDSKLVTRCTSPTDIQQCRGICLGDMCVGLCGPDHAPGGGIAGQARIESEMKESYRFRYLPKRGPGGTMEH